MVLELSSEEVSESQLDHILDSITCYRITSTSNSIRMSYPIPSVDPDNINPNLPEENHDDEHGMTPAEHWDRIMDTMETLQVQCDDLQEMLKDFNKSAL